MICSRLKEVLPDLIDDCQGAFVSRRSILDNILICQDMLKAYYNKRKTPWCTIKVDLRKAYDFVSWEFIQGMMYALKFPTHFISWVMQCVTTPTFSLLLNGGSYGLFKGKKGIRQGDPKSPLLFVIVMEYLSRLLKNVGKKRRFKYHQRCKELALNHLIFADDLMLFSYGTNDSVKLLIKALKTFEARSSLQANLEKTAIYFGNVQQPAQDSILCESGFVKGNMPFRYLGIPLNAKYLKMVDYDSLIDKMLVRLHCWSSRNLSYAARVTLINAVGNVVLSTTPPIAWDWCCRPKKAGGLGIRDCRKCNKAALGVYVWKIAKKTDSLWVKWVHSVYIKGWLNNKYKIRDGYNWLQGDLDKVQWCNWVWNPFNIPKHTFIVRLAVLGGLKTRDNLFQYGVSNSSDCLLCGDAVENCSHLFFSCSFNRKVLKAVSQWIGFDKDQVDILHNWKLWKAEGRNHVQKNLILASLTAVVYSIWLARNHALWHSAFLRPEFIAKVIRREVVTRFQQIINHTWTIADCKWLHQLRNSV
ncbi:uncharacterized protein LOC110732117 [Chenopodium quinoa]|uniref:uncharacterized protein LOC110732117 n=1 Tax=Chenopodium quinoa TaxID=63459 RepID=UPI000B79A783|nr:uncharacterized protein LOC110732117 [Chenopodium quinoa]